MAQNKYHRLALAQLSFNPAYFDESGVSYLHEPFFHGEDGAGLHKLAGLSEVRDLRNRIATRMIDHMSHKLKAVIEFAGRERAELLLLPEYSVPPELLEECQKLARQFKMLIVAGSHVVSKAAIAEYARLKLTSTPQSAVLSRSACPVFFPDGTCRLVEKIHRTKWEASMVPGLPNSPIATSLNGDSIQLAVSICIDAISDAKEVKSKRGRTAPILTVIPSLTPSLDLFNNKGQLLLASERVTLFANISEFGGSKVFARAELTKNWLAAPDGSAPIPKHAEALIIADVDLSGQFEVRKSTVEHFPVKSLSVIPLVYTQHSDACREFVEFVSQISTATNDSELSENIKRFVAMDYRLFPRLMQEKLSHFLEHVAAPGLADLETSTRWLTPVSINTTQSTDALRWDLSGQAIDIINELNLADRYPDKTEDLTATYKHLIQRRKELRAYLEPANSKTSISAAAVVDEPAAPPASSAPFEPPFFDRDPILSSVQQFIGSTDKACFVLAGMRGMGKTSIARQAFKRVVPPSWKRIFVTLAEGASYPRLLAELGHQSGLRLPSESSLDAPAKQMDLAQNLLLTFSHTPRLVIFIDDFQYLLEPNGEFVDEKTRKFISQLIQMIRARKNKLIIVTNHVPKFEKELSPFVEQRYIKGLDQRDSENLFSYWFRFEREDLSEQLIQFPERLLGVLNGHPLGVKIAAKLVAESTTQQVESDAAVFKRLRETIISFFLDRVKLSEGEDELIRFASIFRLPVKRDAFVAWKADQAAFLLDSLLGRSLLETDGDYYNLHPIIREYFYVTTPIQVLRSFHKVAGSFFLESYKKSKTAEPSPELLGEAIHHYLCAGERDKVKGFAFYKYELRPVALTHYRRGEFELALKDYRLLISLDPNEVDSHFHLALLYARKNEWDRAEEHFGKAMRLKPNAFWVLQGYAHIMIGAGRLPEAESILLKAYEINPQHAPTLTDLGVINARNGDEETAESFFKAAVGADPNNAFAYYQYARFLLRVHRYGEGLELATAALETNPRDQRNKQLVDEIRARLDAARPS